jgi:hypothetical protein
MQRMTEPRRINAISCDSHVFACRTGETFSDVISNVAERVFVVGANATGKSNFIDAFRFLRDIASPEGGLQRAIADRGGLDEIRFLGAAADAEVGMDVTIRGEGANSWRYILQYKTHLDGSVAVSKENVLRNDLELLQRPDDEDKRDPLRLRQTALEQVATNREFRELVDFSARSNTSTPRRSSFVAASALVR